MSKESSVITPIVNSVGGVGNIKSQLNNNDNLANGVNKNSSNVEEFDLDGNDSSSEITNKEYIVSKYGSGEGFSTLWSISEDSGVSIADIKAANPDIGDDNIIHPGQKIIVPIKGVSVDSSINNSTSNQTTIVSEKKSTTTEELDVDEVIETKAESIVTQASSVVTSGVAISSVKVPSSLNQTGIIPNYTNYEYFYGKWNRGTKQCQLSEIWAAGGKTNDRGIATIDDNYLVAVSPKFGKTGDKIGVVLEDGTVIDCIIADTKGGDAGSEWGHSFGNNGIDIIEWESLGKQNTINLDGWKGKDVVEIVNYGSILEG